ncbi:General transcription and DNA repair factor IIH helicase subunit XPB [Dirofilaria immitis]
MKFSSIFSTISVVIFYVTKSIIEAEIRIINLSCNFDDGTLCRWRSDSDLWLIGVNVPINSFQFIPHFSNKS